MDVSAGGSSHAPPVPADAASTSGPASSAGPLSAAARSAARTRSSIWSGVTPARATMPVEMPSGLWSIAMTVSWRDRVTPLVVSVLPAQRRLALLDSPAMTTQPFVRDRASARSTVSCGVVTSRPP